MNLARDFVLGVQSWQRCVALRVWNEFDLRFVWQMCGACRLQPFGEIL